MNLDANCLPVQADGDANDQLQRVGMIAVGEALTGSILDTKSPVEALTFDLQPWPGWFVRHPSGSTDNVSGDQLVAALAAFVALRINSHVWLMFKTCIKRFGFAQNFKDGLNGSEKEKLPDFMLARALPLFARALPRWLSYPVCLVADALLVGLALSAVGPVWKDGKGFARRSPDDVDDNCTVCTLAVCRRVRPTPLSRLACLIFGKLRPWNYGCARGNFTSAYHPVYGALRWYHRAEAGGNPEIAELFKPICKEYFE